MSGVIVEHKLGVRQAPRQVDRIAARHYPVLIAIRNKDRLLDRAKILSGLRTPSPDRPELPHERANGDRLIAIRLALLQPSQKGFRARGAPFAVEVKNR